MSLYYSIFDQQFLDAMSQPDVTVATAVKLEFLSGTTRAHSATGELTIEGEIYYGVGALGDISIVNESGDLSSRSVSVILNGLDSSVVGTVLNEKCVGRPAAIYFVAFDSLGQAIAANLLYSGYISASAMTGGVANAVSYTISNVFEKWKDGKSDRYTQESHLALFEGDHIFRYVAQMAERPIYWGSGQDAPPFARFK